MMPIEQLQVWIAQYGYAAIAGLLALGIVGVPVPDETLLTLVGFLVFKGVLHAVPAYLSAFAGSSVGISISYAIGRFGGIRLVRRFGPRIGITADRVKRVESWFHRRGRWALVGGYFVPGVRHLMAIVAGSSGLPYNSFARFAYGGAALWSGCFIAAGFYMGEEWNAFPRYAHPIAIGVFLLIVLAAGAYALYRHRSSRVKS